MTQAPASPHPSTAPRKSMCATVATVIHGHGAGSFKNDTGDSRRHSVGRNPVWWPTPMGCTPSRRPYGKTAGYTELQHGRNVHKSESNTQLECSTYGRVSGFNAKSASIFSISSSLANGVYNSFPVYSRTLATTIPYARAERRVSDRKTDVQNRAASSGRNSLRQRRRNKSQPQKFSAGSSLFTMRMDQFCTDTNSRNIGLPHYAYLDGLGCCLTSVAGIEGLFGCVNDGLAGTGSLLLTSFLLESLDRSRMRKKGELGNQLSHTSVTLAVRP